MSCIKPIAVPVNAKKIYIGNNQKLVNYVPCGKCYECKRQKTEDLMVRMYYDNSKYYIFDTLTYSDECVKTFKKLNPFYNDDNIGDIMVLYYEDYQKFMKRLRKQVEKYDKDCEIKYIVSGEYGSNPRFTNRPHLHIIMMVNKDDIITPLLLSHLIKKCWTFGRTDGADDNGILYFNSQRVFRGFDAKKMTIGYICKYMTKTNYYEKILKDKIRFLVLSTCARLNITASFENIENEVKQLYKKYMQFTKWSQGIGKEYFKCDNIIENYEKNGYLQIRTDLKNKKYRLPLYYKRKLYYDKKGDENVLNDKGIKLQEISLKRNLEYYKSKLKIYGIKNDVEINNIANYWVYYKDRFIIDYKDKYVKPNYNNEYYNNFSSKLDRNIYPNGLIIYDGKEMATTDFVKRYSCRVDYYDKIINKVNKMFSDIKKVIDDDNARKNEIKKRSSALERSTF